MFRALIERDDLVVDERFGTTALRLHNHGILEPLLKDAFSQKTTAEWEDILSPHCLVAPLNTIGQTAVGWRVNARGMFVDLPAWKGSTFSVVNSPVKLSRTAVEVTRGADQPGGHTRSFYSGTYCATRRPASRHFSLTA